MLFSAKAEDLSSFSAGKEFILLPPKGPFFIFVVQLMLFNKCAFLAREIEKYCVQKKFHPAPNQTKSPPLVPFTTQGQRSLQCSALCYVNIVPKVWFFCSIIPVSTNYHECIFDTPSSSASPPSHFFRDDFVFASYCAMV
jgi:hypothetical protein